MHVTTNIQNFQSKHFLSRVANNIKQYHTLLLKDISGLEQEIIFRTTLGSVTLCTTKISSSWYRIQ